MRTTPDEIVLPITEPETEWILDRAVQKVSPTRRHGIVQRVMAEYLGAWARGRGSVATEWRFRITPAGERTRPLVPDVAYLSFVRAAGMTTDQFDVPTIAPEIVVEVLSPDDRRVDVLEKCRVYREASVLLVLVVDPTTRTVERFDTDGSSQFVDAGTSTVSTIPDFVIPYGDAVFAALDEGFGPDGRIVSRP